MAYCRLSDAGIWRASLEQMMYGTVTAGPETQFNDSVLQTKTRKVEDLVAKFDKNLELVDTTTEEEKPVKSMMAKTESKPKTQSLVRQELSMEQFVAGILRTSSPLPPVKDDIPDFESEQFVELQETPILPYRPAKLKVNTTDSVYGSPGSSASSATSTPPEPEMDVYLKLARAQLHKTIEQYSTWKPETLQLIAETGATRRLEALQKIQEPCFITQTMLQIYEGCTSGQTGVEMDRVIVSIFHLLQERVDQPQISVLEEYVVMIFNKKAMQ